MPETAPPPEFARLSLAEIAGYAAERRLPPVESWNPPHRGDSGIRIARDGAWLHEGAPIGRAPMVRLFSSILHREPDGGYALVTPHEKLSIEVEDAPFVAVELKTEGSGRDRRLAFRLNTDDIVIADASHPLRFAAKDGGVQPYLAVRGGLDALVARPVYYELANLAIDEDADPLGLWSEAAFFEFDPAA